MDWNRTNVIKIDLCNLKVVEKWTQIEFILDHILQVPRIALTLDVETYQ